MKYVAPIGSADPNANYTDPVDGTIPAAAVEQPMREIASVISSMGIVPNETDLSQLDQAIDMKVAAVQPDLSVVVTKDELAASQEELLRQVKSLIVEEKYDLCEFYYFRNPTLKPGFMPAEGELLENALSRYPQAWEYLQSCEGQKLCVTEEEWQAMHHATWATLADGTKVGWNGMGGVPFFAPNLYTGHLRLPDLRGMYAEAAGFDGLAVGQAQGDAIRNISGVIYHAPSTSVSKAFAGAFHGDTLAPIEYAASYPKTDYAYIFFTSSRVVPTANKNQPRAWGALACVYLGRPAS